MGSTRPPPRIEWSAVIDALGALTNSVTVRSLYGEGHPAIARADDQAIAAFTRILDDMPNVLVALVDGEFVVCERPAPGLRERLHVLADALVRHDIECVVLQRGLTRGECELLGRALAAPADSPGRVRDEAQSSLVHVLLRFLGGGSGAPATRSAAGVDETHLLPVVRELLAEVTRALLAEEVVDRAGVVAVAKAIVSACQARSYVLDQRSRTGALDDEVAHATNVALMTAAMALAARYPGETCVEVTAAALLHDVGHVFLPEGVRGIPAPLLPENAIPDYRRHTEMGAIALLAAGCPALWVAAALDHHRGVDGQGFPYVDSAAPPHELVRIIALANFFDRKRTRAGGAADDPDDVLRLASSLELRYFGAPLVRLFMGALGVFPAGTTVELSNREPAIVTQVNPRDLWRPQVKLLRGADAGKRLELGEVNALEGRHELSIVRAIPPPLLLRDGALASPRAANPAVDVEGEGAGSWRRPSFRPRAQVAEVTQLIEDVLAVSPDEARAPASPPPPATPSAPPARLELRRDAQPRRARSAMVSDLPAAMEKPVAKATSAELNEHLLAFLSEDPPAPAARAVAPPRPAADTDRTELGAQLRSFVEKPPAPNDAGQPKAGTRSASRTPTVREGTVRALARTEISTKPLVPVPRVPAAVIAKEVGLDPRAGFILMFMDGVSSLDDVIDACGMPAAEAKRIVADLAARGLVELKERG